MASYQFVDSPLANSQVNKMPEKGEIICKYPLICSLAITHFVFAVFKGESLYIKYIAEIV